MNRCTVGLLAAITVVLLIGPAGAQKKNEADTMLEAARQKETLEGDLNGAIKAYGAVVTKYVKTDRAVTAMALVHMAECYRKMGDAQARKIFEQVVREYGDQKDAVAIARAQLGGVPSSGGLAKRLLCAECGDDEADLSPDGRLMVFTDWDSGDLAIRDLSTGQIRRLMAKTGTWTDSNQAFGEGPVFSPDLRQIVYFWEVGNKEDDHQLRVMQNEPGGKSRVLINHRGGDASESPTAWFPDGKSVLVIRAFKDRTRQLVRVSVPDGAAKVLKSVEWRTYQTGTGQRLSPDGRYIVYSALATNPSKLPPAATDPKDQHIYVLAADGSSETEIVKTSGINRNPVWTPDGKHILFTSDRSGKSDLWSIAVQNGKAIGPESLVSADIGDVDAAAMHGGSYYYTHSRAGTEHVNIAQFAPSGDGQIRIARPTESFVGIRTAWSPDGKSISFKRHHPGSVRDYDLVVHSLETGDERTYLTDLGTSGDGPGLWFHDSKTITIGIGPTGSTRVNYRVDLKTGEFRALSGAAGPSALSPDDKTLYVSRNDEKDWTKIPAHVVAMDMSTGQETKTITLPEPGYAYFLLVTPDGRTLVGKRQDPKTKTTHLCLLSIDGVGYRELYTVAQKDFNDNFTVTKDGRWILLAQRHGDNWELIRIPIEGGAPESTGVELAASPYPRSLDINPDGSRIAFTTSKQVQELWTLDNVLSVLK